MATLSGHLTKLQAVNEILQSIGEDPVNSLGSNVPDAAEAERVLDAENRRIQLIGWHANTLQDHTLNKNADNQFVLGVNTLKVDTVNPRGARRRGSPSPSSFIDAGMRRSADDTKWLMWDVDNNSETWPTLTTLTVDLVQLIEFANLTPALQIYVWTSAAHRFQHGTMGSSSLDLFTQADVARAEVAAVNEDLENEDTNIIRDNPHVYSIVYRNNPGFGR